MKSIKIKQATTVLNFHEGQYNSEHLQVLVVHRKSCQLQTNSPAIASLYILQAKNKCTQSFIFNALMSCHGRFESTKKLSPHIS